MHTEHKKLLDQIIKHSGKGTQHTFLDNYLGNTHPRYPINAPTLRKIAKEWALTQKEVSLSDFRSLLTSLVEARSSTEKVMAGILLDSSSSRLHEFDPVIFDQWLDHLQGWAEVDSLCTGPYTTNAIPNNFTKWKKLLTRLSKSDKIEKRRASLVFLCSPLRKVKDDHLIEIAFQNIDRLKDEKEVLITKAISWVLRSAVKHYKKEVENFLNLNSDTLPKIAVRETFVTLKTGKKTKSKPK